MVFVRFMDFGNGELVQEKDIMALNKSFRQLPFQVYTMDCIHRRVFMMHGLVFYRPLSVLYLLEMSMFSLTRLV